MRVSGFHEEQIARLRREQEVRGQTVGSFLRRNGISRHTFYRWRKKYGGLTETEAIRLKRRGCRITLVRRTGALHFCRRTRRGRAVPALPQPGQVLGLHMIASFFHGI